MRPFPTPLSQSQPPAMCFHSTSLTLTHIRLYCNVFDLSPSLRDIKAVKFSKVRDSFVFLTAVSLVPCMIPGNHSY